MRRHGFFKEAGAVLALFAGYLAAARLGLALDPVGGFASFVWPPAGIALATIYLGGARLWPGVALGAAAANYLGGASAPVALAIAVGNTLEAVTGAWLLKRAGFRPSLERLADVLRFLGLGALAASAVGATWGTAVLWAGGVVRGAALGSAWLAWWMGDGLGILVLGSFLVSWAVPPLPKLRPGRWAEAFLLLLTVGGIAAAIFLQQVKAAIPNVPFSYFILPPLIWAAIRFGPRGAAVSTFLLSVVAIYGTATGRGPFAGGGLQRGLLALEIFTSVVTVTMLILAALENDRRRVSEELEKRVDERTADLARSNRALQEEIVQRRWAELELFKRESQLAQAQAVGHVGSWQWDIEEDRVNWSDELHRLYGLPIGSGPGSYENLLEMIHPEDREMVRRTVQEALDARGSFSFDHRVMRPDGTVRWVQSHGRAVCDIQDRAVCMIGTAQDITDRRRAEAALRESEERLRLLVNGIKDHAIFMLDPLGRVASWNEEAERIQGYAGIEVSGKYFSLFYPEADIREGKPDHELREAAERGTFKDEGWRVRKDGSRFWANVVITAVRDADGKLKGFANIARDATDRRRAEEKIRRFSEEMERRVVERTRELEAANRKLKEEISERRRVEESLRHGEERMKESLREKETLLKEIHHRVKNNLQIVHSLLNLQSRHVGDPEALEGLRDCRDRVRAMALVHEKLYRSKDMAHIDFADYIRDLTRGVSQSYGVQARQVRLRVDAEPILLDIDNAVPCGLILYELVSNCFKHAFPDGRPGEVEVYLRRAEDGLLSLGVKDDGVGFPEKASSPGAPSLGLELVGNLVRQLEGKLEKFRGSGTDVRVTFRTGAPVPAGRES